VARYICQKKTPIAEGQLIAETVLQTLIEMAHYEVAYAFRDKETLKELLR
jgi:hypothetical protein